MLTIYTDHLGGTDEVGDSTTRCNANPNHLNRLKSVEILHHLKSQPIFSEASQTEWCELLDCPLTGFSGFSM